MAAGLGYKEFTTGDVLTAADANGYLASQVVMVFASAAARTSAIASPQEGMISYLKDTNSTEYYSGSAWVAIGASGGGMTLINTGGTALSGTSTQVSAIPSGYNSLEIWIVNAQINADTVVGFTVNNDTGANQYLQLKLYNQDTTPGTSSQRTSSVTLNATGMSDFVKNSTENMTKIVIPNYAATGIKQFKVDFVGRQTGIAYTYQLNGLVYCYNTSAITSFELRSLTTGSFSGGTIFVYGVK